MKTFSPTDVRWMRKALELAQKGVGWTRPNPAVGALIVKNGKLLGKGYHKKAGQPHAEIEAIRDALKKGNKIGGATLYVTLEPCSTHGRTGPCTLAIIQNKLKRVVVGAVDPNPHHAGRGFRILRNSGVKVTHGVLSKECQAINRSFNHWIQTGKPWVVAKVAVTLDGYMALPKKMGRWITGEKARRDVHKLRACCDAILVGAGTVRADNPQLTVRGVRCLSQPMRIVVSKSGKLPAKSHVRTDKYAGDTMVYRKASWSKIFGDLGKLDVTQVLVEGGEKVFESLARRNLIHEVWIYFAPIQVGEKVAAKQSLPQADALLKLKLRDVGLKRIGSDLRMTGLVNPS